MIREWKNIFIHTNLQHHRPQPQYRRRKRVVSWRASSIPKDLGAEDCWPTIDCTAQCTAHICEDEIMIVPYSKVPLLCYSLSLSLSATRSFFRAAKVRSPFPSRCVVDNAFLAANLRFSLSLSLFLSLLKILFVPSFFFTQYYVCKPGLCSS